MLAKPNTPYDGSGAGLQFAIPSSLMRSPFTIHSVSIHGSTQHCLARSNARQGEPRDESFSPRPGPSPGEGTVCRCAAPASQVVQAAHGQSAPGAAAQACWRASFPQVHSSRSPLARDPELGVHAGAERSEGSRAGRGDPSARRRDAQPPARGSRSDRTPGARSWGLTERGSLAGPGPKLTTCLGALMVQQRRRRGQRGEACAARVCCRRRPSAFFQRPAGATIGPRCRRPCANWFALRGSHPHWSCSTAKAQEQLLLLSFTVSTLFSNQCKARGRLHQPPGSAECPP